MNLRQVIPSQYCLQCRGCCVFTQPRSKWGVHLAAEEEIFLEHRYPGVSFGGRLLTEPGAEGRYNCQLLQLLDHRCRGYEGRPLECALYPLLLSSENGGLRLYAHEACPFVRENFLSSEWQEHVEGVKRYLLDTANRALLKDASANYPDYSVFKEELQFIADIEFTDGAAALLASASDLGEWFNRRPTRLSARSFVAMFAWVDYFDFVIEESFGNKLIVASQRGCEFLYCPPLGAEISQRAVDQAFKMMKGGAARIEAVSTAEIACFDANRYHVELQGKEYCYDRKSISSLNGKSFSSKRGDINYCLKNSSPFFRPFDQRDARACHALFDRWLDRRRSSDKDGVYRAMLVENRIVHRRMVDHASALGLVGRVVKVGGEVVGYTFGYRLNDDVFCVALEVVDPDIKGLAAYIFREFCADKDLAGYKYINAMDDFGMPAVAKAKRSWRPVFLEKVYSICLKP